MGNFNFSVFVVLLLSLLFSLPESSFISSLFWRMGFPDSSAGKESTCNVRDQGSIPGLGRSPGEGKGYPLQYSGLENSYSPWGRTVRHDWVTFTFTFASTSIGAPGFVSSEGRKGNPLLPQAWLAPWDLSHVWFWCRKLGLCASVLSRILETEFWGK